MGDPKVIQLPNDVFIHICTFVDVTTLRNIYQTSTGQTTGCRVTSGILEFAMRRWEGLPDEPCETHSDGTLCINSGEPACQARLMQNQIDLVKCVYRQAYKADKDTKVPHYQRDKGNYDGLHCFNHMGVPHNIRAWLCFTYSICLAREKLTEPDMVTWACQINDVCWTRGQCGCGLSKPRSATDGPGLARTVGNTDSTIVYYPKQFDLDTTEWTKQKLYEARWCNLDINRYLMLCRDWVRFRPSCRQLNKLRRIVLNDPRVGRDTRFGKAHEVAPGPVLGCLLRLFADPIRPACSRIVDSIKKFDHCGKFVRYDRTFSLAPDILHGMLQSVGSKKRKHAAFTSGSHSM